MISAPRLVHEYCSAPPADLGIPVPAAEPCWLCGGEMERGVPVDDWMGATFTNQNKIRSPTSSHICEACVFVTARFSPVPGKPPAEGKKEGPRFSNLSHLWERAPDGAIAYRAASKGEKPVILEFLRRPHAGEWFAAVADTGQKHVLPWTPINPAGARPGRVLFEELAITLPPSFGLVDEIAALLTAGATKEEVGRGDYTAWSWTRCPREVEAFERQHGAKRGSSWWALALWLAQRDEEAVKIREEQEKAARAARRTRADSSRSGQPHAGHGAGARRPAKRIPRDAGGEHPEALGPDSGPGANGGANQLDAGGVDHVAQPQPQAPGAGQLSLSLGGAPDEGDRRGGAPRRPRLARPHGA